MNTENAVKQFQRNFFTKDDEIPDLTTSERQLITAALGANPKRWEGEPDTEQLEAVLSADPTVLERIGAALLKVAIPKRGCGAAVKFLLDHDVPLEIVETEYNVLHEAAYCNAAVDTLQAVFESGAADATSVAVEKPHTGWPDNTSLMYWGLGNVEIAKLLIKYGVGVHHELKIKGNGERGTTSLQEALSHEPVGNRKHEVAQLLIEDGAYYDVYSACALNDTARLKTLMKEEPGVITAVEDYQMTPLHWAARAGAMECAEILLKHGASVNALNKAQRAPLQLAADRDKVDMIRLLVAHGAGLNTQDKKGRTPLHRATYGGRVAAAEALLEVGANPMMLTKTGKNAFEIARKDAKYLKERA